MALWHKQFLSTLSLRRATIVSSALLAIHTNFYPRSPCGERRRSWRKRSNRHKISIHALLAESDTRQTCQLSEKQAFLSTLSLRRATLTDSPSSVVTAISIHALLAESDRVLDGSKSSIEDFYPRSPCGERRWLRCWQLAARDISIHALLAESDERPHRHDLR